MINVSFENFPLYFQLSDSTSDSTDNLWLRAESGVNIRVPDVIKNMLNINGYENRLLISQIDDCVISSIEEFARNDLPHIISKDEFKKYYGIFSDKPDKFRFVIGHRQIIKIIAEFFQKELNETNYDGVGKNITKKSSSASSQQTQKLSCDVSCDESVDLQEERQKLFHTMKSWARLKVDAEKWCSFENNFQNIGMEIKLVKGYPNDQLYCTITCFCGSKYKLPKLSKRNSQYARWITSNFYTHLTDKHINISSTTSNKSAPKVKKTLDSYFKKKSTEKIRVLQNVIIRPSASASAVNSAVNEESNPGPIQKCLSIPFLDNNGPPPSPLQNFPNNALAEKNNMNSDLDSDADIFNEQSESQSNTENQVIKSSQKWKDIKYQRSERLKRARERLSDQDFKQKLLTDYYGFIDEVCNAMSAEFTEKIVNNIANADSDISSNGNMETSIETKKEKLSLFLQKLLDNAIGNSDHMGNNNSYDEFTKNVSLYLFYTAGRIAYETLQANLKNCLPSISTLNRFVDNKQKRLEEGSFDFEGLRDFLEMKNLPKVIWISEDGTRVNGRIEYDSICNKIVGFVLPLAKGLPQSNRFIASSSSVIQEYFQEGVKSSYAYVIVAQPLTPGSPSYCVSMFGTDNKFNHKDVIERWKYIKQEAKKFGITVLGFSSDGDTRLLKAMRIVSGLGNLKEDVNFDKENTGWRWYHSNDNVDEGCFFQDFIHILTKLRVRLLNSKVKLTIGNYQASPEHLITIINTVSKDKHLLTMTDVKAEDKMNFLSAEKMCSIRVIELLKVIPNSNGTQLYLKIMHFILSAFLSVEKSAEQIPLCETIYRVWFVVFILRAWRASIKKSKILTLQDNFISTNCYTCIELNAHNIIKTVLLFKFNNSENNLQSNMFYLPNMSSQPCEKLFRAARSMTSTFSTIINFSIKEFLYKICRINTINNIIGKINSEFLFPREVKKRRDRQHTITQEEIMNVDITSLVEKALQDAMKEVQQVGIIADKEDFLQLDLERVLEGIPENNTTDRDDTDNFQIKENPYEDKDNNESELMEIPREVETFVYKDDELDLKDYSDKIKNVEENSAYVEVQLKDGSAIIKKSSFCWLLSECNGRISNDRLKRFIVGAADNTLGKSKLKKSDSIMDPKKSKQNRSKKGDIEKSVVSKESSANADEPWETECKMDEETADGESYQCEGQLDVNMEESIRDITIGNFYAVAYDKQWFIGKVLDIRNGNKFKVKFLKLNNNQFVWPRQDDIDIVELKYFFFGPLELSGSGPFTLRRHDLITIEKKYKVTAK